METRYDFPGLTLDDVVQIRIALQDRMWYLEGLLERLPLASGEVESDDRKDVREQLARTIELHTKATMLDARVATSA